MLIAVDAAVLAVLAVDAALLAVFIAVVAEVVKVANCPTYLEYVPVLLSRQSNPPVSFICAHT